MNDSIEFDIPRLREEYARLDHDNGCLMKDRERLCQEIKELTAKVADQKEILTANEHLSREVTHLREAEERLKESLEGV